MKLKQISGLGTAAQYDVGTSANNIVALDSNGKLPAVDGSQLTNVSAGGGGSESSTNIPKYTITNISSATIANYTSSTSPLELSSLKTVATMDLFYVDMTATADYHYIKLPAASSLNQGEYIVVAKKATPTSSTYSRIYFKWDSNDTLWHGGSSSTSAYLYRSGSAMLISDGSSNWYIAGWGVT